MSGVVTASATDGVGIIELSRPEKFNCLSMAVISGIDEALTRFEADRSVRAILVRSQGKHFCTGADLEEVSGLRGDGTALQRFLAHGHRVFSRLEASPLPVIAAVQGLCLAGGIELMLSCDVIFAAKSTQVGDQHARYGLVPGWGGSQRLPRVVGVRRALDLLYTARWLKAEEALQWGLVNYVVEDGELGQAAMDYCRSLVVKSPTGLAMMKQLARDGIELSLEEANRLERDVVIGHMVSADVSEGLAAFQGRREPQFKNRV